MNGINKRKLKDIMLLEGLRINARVHADLDTLFSFYNNGMIESLL